MLVLSPTFCPLFLTQDLVLYVMHSIRIGRANNLGFRSLDSSMKHRHLQQICAGLALYCSSWGIQPRGSFVFAFESVIKTALVTAAHCIILHIVLYFVVSMYGK